MYTASSATRINRILPSYPIKYQILIGSERVPTNGDSDVRICMRGVNTKITVMILRNEHAFRFLLTPFDEQIALYNSNVEGGGGIRATFPPR